MRWLAGHGCAADYALRVARGLSEFRLLHPMIRSSELEPRSEPKSRVYGGGERKSGVNLALARAMQLPKARRCGVTPPLRSVGVSLTY